MRRSDQATPAQLALASEQRRFEALFRGTPVVFALQDDATLRVEVPLRYCFDVGRALVKPPLAAVLDRLARSQRNEPTLLAISAPTDAGAKGLQLGIERAMSARRRMVAQGVAQARFSIAAVAGGGVLKIEIGEAAAS